MPQSELPRARLLVWWNRYELVFVAGGLFVIGALLGGAVVSYTDRAERMAMAKRHDDEVRDFRMSCRRTVDQRDELVQKATQAAADAARAAADAAADDSPAATSGATPARGPAKPAVAPRKPPADLGAAVREANSAITGAQR